MIRHSCSQNLRNKVASAITSALLVAITSFTATSFVAGSALAQPGKSPASNKPTNSKPTKNSSKPPVQKPVQAPITKRIPPPSGKELALRLHDEAQTLYQEGRYIQAVEKLEEALGHDPDAIVLHYNLGLIREKMGDLEEALMRFRTCLDLEQNPAERIRLERTVARLEGAVRYGSVSQPRLGSADRHNPFEVAPTPKSPPKPSAPSPPAAVHPAVVISAAVAGSGLLLGSSLAIFAQATDPGRSPTTNATTSYQDLQADADAAHNAAIAADIALVVGAVAAASAVTVAIVLPAGGEQPSQAALRLSPTSAQLVVSF